jgi:hypothetical protein
MDCHDIIYTIAQKLSPKPLIAFSRVSKLHHLACSNILPNITDEQYLHDFVTINSTTYTGKLKPTINLDKLFLSPQEITENIFRVKPTGFLNCIKLKSIKLPITIKIFKNHPFQLCGKPGLFPIIIKELQKLFNITYNPILTSHVVFVNITFKLPKLEDINIFVAKLEKHLDFICIDNGNQFHLRSSEYRSTIRIFDIEPIGFIMHAKNFNGIFNTYKIIKKIYLDNNHLKNRL